MIPTKFQSHVQAQVKQGKSVLLVAPTGLGKTFAVTGDLQDRFCKTIYAVPLRALGGGIHNAVKKLKRNGHIIDPVIHHGDIQESQLFSEEVVVTTYDQVVCGVPGLPLSLPLKAGHAVAGALLMSRLVLDEVHLAWGISNQALTILLAIIDFRRKLGLQTVVLTATLPNKVAKLISERLGLELIVVGEDDMADDEGLKLREANRQLAASVLELRTRGKGESKQLDYSPLDEKLITAQGKRIYFSNTVKQLQQIYDRLTAAGLQPDRITVLHNRMPRSRRNKAEEQVHARFSEKSPDGDWLLLTTQVAEAGLDISAPLVISDPAPVDTLVQRAGRCARWFRDGVIKGEFLVLTAPKAQLENRKDGLVFPYTPYLVQAALQSFPQGQLNRKEECDWIDEAWGGDSKKAIAAVERALNEMTFALNLFDRAAQEHKPGEVANVFREILSVEVAVEEGSCVYLDDLAKRNLPALLAESQHPETSSISLRQAWALLREAEGRAAVIRFDNDQFILHPADYIQLGDILIVPSTIAYLHPVKGLCFGDGANVGDAILSSEWLKKEKVARQRAPGRRQTLFEHTSKVMDGTYRRLNEPGAYRHTLVTILKSIEPEKDVDQLANLIAEFARVAAAFHDLGKADRRWQARAREIDPKCPPELIGRTSESGEQIGVPHTPASYAATIKAGELLIGDLPSTVEHLIRAIALATARHHSSLLNPATVKHVFQPHSDTVAFVREVLTLVKAPPEVLEKAQDVIAAAKMGLTLDQVPLMLPNDDLFPIYALVGRAILLADREDARGEQIEQWRSAE
jgi:CRISPR-associated endonuclease/helicase Cas3